MDDTLYKSLTTDPVDWNCPACDSCVENLDCGCDPVEPGDDR